MFSSSYAAAMFLKLNNFPQDKKVRFDAASGITSGCKHGMTEINLTNYALSRSFPGLCNWRGWHIGRNVTCWFYMPRRDRKDSFTCSYLIKINMLCPPFLGHFETISCLCFP